MKVAVISNNDLCIPLLYFLLTKEIEAHLYFGAGSVIDPKRQDVHRFCDTYRVSYTDETVKEQSLYQWIEHTNPDFVFILGHLKKIDCQKVSAKFGLYNIHFGTLPEYRGASPVFWQLKRMEPLVGLCIHGLTKEMDAGPIFWKKEIKNESHFSHSYVQYLFSNLLLDGVNEILVKGRDGSLKGVEQDEAGARWYSKPSLDDVMIRWDVMPAFEISCLVRACNNWNAGAITIYQGMELKIIDASYKSGETVTTEIPGTITSIGDCITATCLQGEELYIHYLSLNGIPFGSRHARQFGIVVGERLTYPPD
jgi:methionyl-tRNA formyltransferase